MTPVLERSLIQTTFIGSKKTQEAVHAMFELVSTLIFKKYPCHQNTILNQTHRLQWHALTRSWDSALVYFSIQLKQLCQYLCHENSVLKQNHELQFHVQGVLTLKVNFELFPNWDQIESEARPLMMAVDCWLLMGQNQALVFIHHWTQSNVNTPSYIRLWNLNGFHFDLMHTTWLISGRRKKFHIE